MVEKMIELHLMWFEHVSRKRVEVLIKIVDQTKYNLIVIGKERSKKVIVQNIKRELEVNSLSLDLMYDRTLRCQLFHVTNSTQREKGWIDIAVIIVGEEKGMRVFLFQKTKSYTRVHNKQIENIPRPQRTQEYTIIQGLMICHRCILFSQMCCDIGSFLQHPWCSAF